MDEFRFDAEDAEDEAENGAADVEEELADIDDAAAEVAEMLKDLVKGLPSIEMFGTSKFVPVNETYWKNYPSADNYYEGPWWWWSNFKFIAAKVEPNKG